MLEGFVQARSLLPRWLYNVNGGLSMMLVMLVSLMTMVVMIGWYRLERKFTGDDFQNLVQVLLALF